MRYDLIKVLGQWQRIRSLSTGCTVNGYDAMKYRKWVYLNDMDADSTRISVMSYNLLSRHYVWKQVFGYLDQRYIDWDYRFKLINETVRQFSCDLMCFQEMEHSVYENFWSQDFPSPKFKSFYTRKSPPAYWDGRPEEHMDGVGIFVNTDVFEVQDELPVSFGEYIKSHESKFDITADTAERVIPRNTVALILKLKDKRNGKQVYVTNTHLYWSPKFNDVKVFQTKLLLNLLRDFMDKDSVKNPIIIMCGDFNSTPSSSVFRLLKKGYIFSEECQELLVHHYGKKLDNEIIENGLIKSPFRLACTYDYLLKGENQDERRLKFTSFTKSLKEVLDHVWYTQDNLNVHKILSEVDSTYISTCDGFPNKHFPSDHIPLVAELYYT